MLLAAYRLRDRPRRRGGARPGRGGGAGRPDARRGAPAAAAPAARATCAARAACGPPLAAVAVRGRARALDGAELGRVRPPRAGGHELGHARWPARTAARPTRAAGSAAGGRAASATTPATRRATTRAADDGVRYARDHAGRLPVVLAARFGRVWSLYDPFQIARGALAARAEARDVVFFLLVPFAAWGTSRIRRRGEGCGCCSRPPCSCR